MLVERIKYTDYNGKEREENFFFNLSKAELMEMELSTDGGLSETLKSIIKSENQGKIIETFKKLILKAYGEKSDDGKVFRKVNDQGVPLSIAFSQTEAYSELFMKLATDAEYSSKFVKGIIPSDIDIGQAEEIIKSEGFLNNSDNQEPNKSTNIIPIDNK